jgi:hypothetical protein
MQAEQISSCMILIEWWNAFLRVRFKILATGNEPGRSRSTFGNRISPAKRALNAGRVPPSLDFNRQSALATDLQDGSNQALI